MTEHKRYRRPFLLSIIIAGIFFIINLILILNHEPSAVIKPLLPYPILNIISLIVSTLLIFVFVFFSKFRLWVKILIPLSAVFFYNNIVNDIISGSVNAITNLFGDSGSIATTISSINEPFNNFFYLFGDFLDGYNLAIFGHHLPILPILLAFTLLYLLVKSPRLSLLYLLITTTFTTLTFFDFSAHSTSTSLAPVLLAIPFFFTWFAESEDREPKFIRKKVIDLFSKLEIAKLISGKITGSTIIFILIVLSIPQTLTYANFDLNNRLSYSKTITEYLNKLEDDAFIISNIKLYLPLSSHHKLSAQSDVASGNTQEVFEQISNLEHEHIYYLGSLNTCATSAVPETWEKVTVFNSTDFNPNEPNLVLYQVKD